ncbi:MAG: hypothetical protein QOD77_2125 [Thermoplasmata archaeon]|nr:hypothetical protein [Thermoplasmata archaeon]
MSKLLVAVLIGLLAFAALMAGMMALGPASTDAADAPSSPSSPSSPRAVPPPPAPTTTTARPASGTVTVEAVDVAWAPGPALRVEVTLRNTGDAAAEATAADWTFRLQGDRVDDGHADLGAALPPGRATVAFEVPFDGGLAADWMREYADNDERARAAVAGTLSVLSGGRALRLEFTWDRAWTGTLAAQVGEAADCDASAAAVCLVSAAPQWSGDDLEVRLKLQNRGDDPVRLRGDVGLALGGVVVAEAELDRTYVGAGGTSTTEVRLAFSADALASWWDGHVAACEASPLQLVLDLSDADGPLGDWALPLPDFHTELACGGAA